MRVLDDDALASLLEEFVADTRRLVSLLEAASAQPQDRGALRREAHTLKSSAALVGAMTLSYQARALEAAAVSAPETELASLVDAVREAADAAVRAIGTLAWMRA